MGCCTTMGQKNKIIIILYQLPFVCIGGSGFSDLRLGASVNGSLPRLCYQNVRWHEVGWGGAV